MIRVAPIKDIIGQGDLSIISICPSSNMDSKYFKAIAKQQENRYKSTTSCWLFEDLSQKLIE